MSDRLTSWTRTLTDEDALRLIGEAEPNLSLADWTERGHEELPQASRERRTGLIRLVRRHLMDWTDDDTVADTRWLTLMQSTPPGTRLDLLHGRYLFEHPWVLRAQEQLIGLRLAASEEPLAPHDADLISHADWVAFVEANIATEGPAAVSKTRSVLLRSLDRLGVIKREGERGESTRVCRAQPAAQAFCWLVAHELRQRQMGEATRHWAAHQSRAVLLFRPEPAYANRCLDRAPALGLLRESFIAGEPRLLLEPA